MVDDETRVKVRALLRDAEVERGRVPVGRLVALTEATTLDLSIDTSESPAVVYAQPRRSPVFDALSRREQEIASLLADGLSNRLIAQRLHISVATVKDHVHAVLHKTGLPSRQRVAAAWFVGADGSPAGPTTGEDQ